MFEEVAAALIKELNNTFLSLDDRDSSRLLISDMSCDEERKTLTKRLSAMPGGQLGEADALFADALFFVKATFVLAAESKRSSKFTWDDANAFLEFIKPKNGVEINIGL